MLSKAERDELRVKIEDLSNGNDDSVMGKDGVFGLLDHIDALEAQLAEERRDKSVWVSKCMEASTQLAQRDERIEQLEVQLAGCSVAATGWATGERRAVKGDWGWSPAYQDVVTLRAKCDEALMENRKLHGFLAADAKGEEK